MAETPRACAREMLEVIPTVMRFIRAEMRGNKALDLGVPQFRSLVFLERTEGASLTAVAGHLGLTPPSTCRLIDGLAARGMVRRRSSAEDRRRLVLELTPAGARALTTARAGALTSMATLLSPLPAEERATVVRAMDSLRRAFAAEGKGKPRGTPGA